MSQYLRVVRKGKHNVRVELPDHTTQLVPTDQLPLWELVQMLSDQSHQDSVSLDNPTTDVVPSNPVVTNTDPKKYLKVLRKGKHNCRVLLPNKDTCLVSLQDLPNWELVSEDVGEPSNSTQENMDEEIREIFDDSNPTTVVEETTTVVEETTEEVQDNNREVLQLTSLPEQEEEKPKKRGRAKKEKITNNKETNFRRNSNGLGQDHPYESVNMEYNSVEFEEGVEAPF